MNVNQRLQLHYSAADAFAKGHGCRLVSVCLHGSQNYGLADENSDVDTVALIVPQGEELIFGEKFSKELHIDEEHCVVKDIRFLYFELCKGSPNMLEALMTDFYLDAPEYHDRMQALRERREKYARINMDRTIDSLCGMGLSKTGKNYHAARVAEMIERYSNGEPYKSTLISKDLEWLRQIKKANQKNEEDCALLKSILNQPKAYSIDEEAKADLKVQVLGFFSEAFAEQA